jgi:uncharacterized protein
MRGIAFTIAPEGRESAPNRADICCFSGFIKVRKDGGADEPVAITNWNAFDQQFAWEMRGGAEDGTTYLGAAVRSYFAQGGRRCYVVRAGDPLGPLALRKDRVAQIALLIPGYPRSFDPSPTDRVTWKGAGALFGLPDVSFLCLPDLPNAVGIDGQQPALAVEKKQVKEQFLECSAEPQTPVDKGVRLLPAPRCDEQGYRDWTRALWLVADTIARFRREVQLLAAIPIPVAGSPEEGDLLLALANGGAGPLALRTRERMDGLASAFVQLCYPWARTPGSGNMPEQLEPPDAIVAGVLARSILARGSFRSAANANLADVRELYPSLGREQTETARPYAGRKEGHSLEERVTLLGQTPTGLRLLSDVTTSLNPAYRPAPVNRLVAAIVRAARRTGEELVFESSGERLWAQLRDRLETLLTGLFEAGALRGSDPLEAFEVRCDRSTMTQTDIDSGRVIARVQFDAAAPLEHMVVALGLSEGGQVTVEEAA